MTAAQPVHDRVHDRSAAAPDLPTRCGWEEGAPQCWPVGTPARARLRLTFRRLTRYGIVAGPMDGTDAIRLRTQLRERIRRRWPHGDGACAFWLTQHEADCFDTAGELRHPLPIYVDGPATAEAVATALRQVGLTTVPGDEPDSLLLTAVTDRPGMGFAW